MNIVMFYHTLLSDWNHGNAHFLRGIVTELLCRGHKVTVFEPQRAWSLKNLLAEHGWGPVRKFFAAYPGLHSTQYSLDELDLDKALDGADLVLVHEWNEPALIRSIGRHHEQTGTYRLFFHDTHHRLVTEPESITSLELASYDGVLAYGAALRELYERNGGVQRAWTWHEAADTCIFRPMSPQEFTGDLVWVGNWGDGERTAELEEFLVKPSQELAAKTSVYGVRYPANARKALADAGINYAGWLPNFEVPRVFACYRATVHIPRRPYVKALPGIPTIRPFEALACGIPLVCSPWDDVEGLFTPGEDYLVAHDGQEMIRHLKGLFHDREMAQELARHGLKTILSRHTCAHRVDQLLRMEAQVRGVAETRTVLETLIK